MALRLGLDHAHGRLYPRTQVVGAPMALLHHHLADGNPRTGEEVQRVPALYDPASISKLTVDEQSGSLLSSQSRRLVVIHDFAHNSTTSRLPWPYSVWRTEMAGGVRRWGKAFSKSDAPLDG